MPKKQKNEDISPVLACWNNIVEITGEHLSGTALSQTILKTIEFLMLH